MALLQSCKPMRVAASSAAAARRVLPAVGSTFMQLLPRQQAPCRQMSAEVQVANMGVQQPAGGAPVYAEPQAAAPVPPPMSSAVFTDFSVYKTKGAMSVKPIKPTWAATSQNGWKMERNGAMLFELANSIGERRYNWEQKVIIGLQANELSTILSDPKSEHNFYHDTFKGQQGRQGTLVKTLRWTGTPDGRGYFITASVDDKGNNIKNTVTVSLTHAEFYTFKRLIDYSIPYMLGWDTLFNTPTV